MKKTVHLVQLGPIEQLRAGKLIRRLAQLMLGLTFYGISMAMMVRGNLGQAPWDALHLGITAHLPVSFGWVVVGLSFVVLLLWVPVDLTPSHGQVLA